MQYLFLTVVCLSLINCNISWYVKDARYKDRVWEDPSKLTLENVTPGKSTCLISTIRFITPYFSDANFPFPPLSKDSTNSASYNIVKPGYNGLAPEYLNYLTERLKNRKDIKIKKIIYEIPETWKENDNLKILKSDKNLARYTLISSKSNQSPMTAEILKSYADIVDSKTHFLYNKEDPNTYDMDDCDHYLYFDRYRKEKNTHNSILFLLTLGVLPLANYENNYYVVIIIFIIGERQNSQGQKEKDTIMRIFFLSITIKI